MKERYTFRVKARLLKRLRPFLGPQIWLIISLLFLADPVVFGQQDSEAVKLKLPGRYRLDRILVKPKAGMVHLPQLASGRGGKVKVLRTYDAAENLQLVQVPEGSTVEELVALYQESGLVEYAEPDYLVHALNTPNDPRYADGTLWGLNNLGRSGGILHADISAVDAWKTQTSASNIIVAIVDTGIRYTHEDLAANMWVNPGEIPNNRLDDDRNGYVDDVHGINAVTNTGDPKDDGGHGTHVAGIIGAVGNNGKGVVGVAWKVQLMSCKFMDSFGMGAISDAIQCIDYARAKGAKVINSSWGSSDSSLSLRSAISRARSAGIVFVAAAGNESANDDVVSNYPSGFDLDNIVSVGASTRSDRLADFSNFGAATVDLVAPGSTIYSTWSSTDSSYSYDSGTSMAAPYVSGAFALLRAQFPNDTAKQLIDRLYAATDPVPGLSGKCVTGGRLNVQRALEASLIANFAASSLTGTPPLAVAFQDTSFGPIVERRWDFGDNSPTSTKPNPTHTYEFDGNFTVTLTVTDANGLSSSKSRVISVVANYEIARRNFNWIDPTDMTRLYLSDNGVSAAQALPFTFVFYGQTYDQIYVSANGLIGFDNRGLSTSSNVDLKNISAPNAMVCAYWDNLNPAAGGSVRIGTVGTEPNRRTVISWVGVPKNSTPSAVLTFQAVLEESSRQVLLQYLEVQPENSRGAGRTATIGVENETGLIAAKYTYDGSPAVLANRQTVVFIPRGLGGMLVTPAPQITITGNVGGPFSFSPQGYEVQNLGDRTLRWKVNKTQDWLELSVGSGVLTAGQRTNVAVSLTDRATSLVAGSYSDTLSFVNQDSGTGNTTRTVSLVVNGTTGVLTITPDTHWRSIGGVGGPFDPITQVYTLINTGDATLNWTAVKSQEWTTLSASSGALAPGDSATVSVSVNESATSLAAGDHTDMILFSNTTNGLGGGERKVSLAVGLGQPIQLTIESAPESGQFRLRLRGQAGKSYAIESSTDLVNWKSVVTQTLPVKGAFEFTETETIGFAQKYYRAVAVP
ncbi:MAG: PKD domain-containing protein [Verrucomicrobia bacterium]|nr:PKD domain-containing protein [Verrucomicrobiota bacterium]